MEFLTRGYEALRGPQGAPQSATDTILKLTDRLAHGTLLEDRRAAVLGLKGLSRDWKLDVGRASLPGLMQALGNPADRQDVEMCKAVLETLNVLCLRDEPTSPSTHRWSSNATYEAGAEFSDALIDQCPITELILEILLDNNFYVRWFALQLLTTLLSNRSSSIQEGILSAPGGCGRLMEMLSDRREIIRNEALLLLIALTESNADIQKIIAFENAFQILFDLILREDGVGGGIVVQDCLVVIGNLLRYNVSNQNFFRETSCIHRLPEILGVEKQSTSNKGSSFWATQEWQDQKVVNVRMVLSIVKLLLVPGNLSTTPNQRALLSSGLVKAILEMALASNAPSKVKTIALYLLADAIRGLPTAQDFLLHATVSPIPESNAMEKVNGHEEGIHTGNSNHEAFVRKQQVSTVPALLPLVEIALGKVENVSLSHRAAACYVFECLLHENHEAQLVLMSTMTPPPAANPNDTIQASNQSAGSLILAALTEGDTGFADPYCPWFACTLLSHILKDNEKAKRIARNINFGDSEAGEESVSLVQTIVGNFMLHSGAQERRRSVPSDLDSKTTDIHPSIGYLCLLCIWLWESPKTVKELLSEGSNLQLLVAPVSQSSGVHPLVQGLCAFLLGICYEYNRDNEHTPARANGDSQIEDKNYISRATMQPILLQRIGVDQFINRITRLREYPAFRDASPELHVIEQISSLRESASTDLDTLTFADALPDLVFDYAFVELLKSSYLSIQRSITVDPAEVVGESRSRKDPELVAEVNRLRGKVKEQEVESELLNSRLRDIDLTNDRERNTLLNEITGLSDQVKTLTEELSNTQTELSLAKSMASKGKSLQTEATSLAGERTSLLAQVDRLQQALAEEKIRADEALRDKDDFAMLLEDTLTKRNQDKIKLREAGINTSDNEADEEDEDGEGENEGSTKGEGGEVDLA